MSSAYIGYANVSSASVHYFHYKEPLFPSSFVDLIQILLVWILLQKL